MAFKEMQRTEYPPRLWTLAGYPGSGKTTFATQMQGPLLVIDADHRFREVLDLAGKVLELSHTAGDNVSSDRIKSLLEKHMPGSSVRTIVVDSLTAIIIPLVVQAMIDKESGKQKNLLAGFRAKALAMRQLQDAVTCWGVDTLWIYHFQDSRNTSGRQVVRSTISQTELARLMRSINIQLRMYVEKGKHWVEVVWARRGNSGAKIMDDTGCWAGMPERIEAVVYNNLTFADQDEIEKRTPSVFPNAETAIAWGLEKGAFNALQHSRNAYNKLKETGHPRDAQSMAKMWIADVEERLDGAKEGGVS